MYTKEDFWRDYPPKDQPFAFPWTEEYHQRVIEQARKEAYEKAREEARNKAREEARIEERRVIARTMHSLGLDSELIKRVTGLTVEEIQGA